MKALFHKASLVACTMLVSSTALADVPPGGGCNVTQTTPSLMAALALGGLVVWMARGGKKRG